MPFLAPGDLERCGLAPDGLVLANPLAAEESILRTSLLPGLLKAVAYNESHRQPGCRGCSSSGGCSGSGTSGCDHRRRPSPSWRAGCCRARSSTSAVVLAGVGRHRGGASCVELLLRSVGRWYVPRSTVTRRPLPRLRRHAGAAVLPGLHPGRAASVRRARRRRAGRPGGRDRPGGAARPTTSPNGSPGSSWTSRRCCDLPAMVPLARPVSRFPSSDIDLAFVVDESIPPPSERPPHDPGRVGPGASRSSVELFDVFRSEQLGRGPQEPGVPAPVPGAGPDADRRRGRRTPGGDHRRGRESAHGATLRG